MVKKLLHENYDDSQSERMKYISKIAARFTQFFRYRFDILHTCLSFQEATYLLEPLLLDHYRLLLLYKLSDKNQINVRKIFLRNKISSQNLARNIFQSNGKISEKLFHIGLLLVIAAI